MTKPDYTAFDAELLRLIGCGITYFTGLCCAPSVRAKATPFTSERSSVDRVFDRRLQALRKAGKIRYRAGKWELTNTAHAGDQA